MSNSVSVSHIVGVSALICSPFLSCRVVVAGSVGILSGLLACFAIAMVYIPSFISSVLQLRSGVIPSLRDRDFLMYRYAGMSLLAKLCVVHY